MRYKGEGGSENLNFWRYVVSDQRLSSDYSKAQLLKILKYKLIDFIGFNPSFLHHLQPTNNAQVSLECYYDKTNLALINHIHNWSVGIIKIHVELFCNNWWDYRFHHWNWVIFPTRGVCNIGAFDALRHQMLISSIFKLPTQHKGNYQLIAQEEFLIVW